VGKQTSEQETPPMPSIPDTLRSTAARCPDREAVVCGQRWTSYREPAEQVESMASRLAAHGLEPGDRALLMSTITDTFVITAYAVLRTGALLVPANPRSGTTGKPKGALFDHHRALWVGNNIGGACGFREDDRVLHVAPLYHAAELAILLWTAPCAG